MPATKKRTEKPVFTWDEERSLGFAYPEEGARKCIEAKRAKKDGKDYIVLTEWRFFARKNEDGTPGEEQWNPIKGFTIPAHNFPSLAEFVDSDLADDPATEQEPEEDDEGAESDAE